MERYIDMHCHILPGVDDGSSNMEETEKMLRIAHAEGICCIIATPHYHPRRGHEHPDVLREKLIQVRRAAQRIDNKFRIYLGTEIYYGQDVPDKLQQERILSMNRRNCVLVEFSPADSYNYIRQGLEHMQLNGYEVILAHAERYLCFIEHFEYVEHIWNMGVNIQINAGSVTGDSGKRIKQFVKQLMENDMVFCVSTDAHNSKNRQPCMKKAAVYVTKKYGEEYAKKIFFTNAAAIVKKTKNEA